jgi:hypothetical protein
MKVAEKLAAAVVDELAERCSRQWTGGDDRLVVAAIDELPRLRDDVLRRQAAAEQPFEPPASPEVMPVERREQKRVERDRVHLVRQAADGQLRE